MLTRKSFLKSTLLSGFTLALGLSLSCKKKTKDLYHSLKDPKNPTGSEKKHVPEIIATSNSKAGQMLNIKVKVGFGKVHPSTPAHWITEIKLLADGKTIHIKYFPKGGQAPETTFKLELHQTVKLEAVAKCNLHGEWISKAYTIKVS